MIRYWCFNETMLEQAFAALAADRLHPEDADRWKRDVLEFLLSPEARAHKLLVEVPAGEGGKSPR